MRFYPLEKLINLHDDYVRQFKIDNLQLLLIQRLGELFLLEAYCPHRGHPLVAASIAVGVIQCSLHQYQFALEDGRLLRATEEPCRALRMFFVTENLNKAPENWRGTFEHYEKHVYRCGSTGWSLVGRLDRRDSRCDDMVQHFFTTQLSGIL